VLPEVRLRLPDEQIVAAGPGAIIGRSHTAEVRIDDGRVSEVHAYVSLRASQLVLLALRGRVRSGERDTPRLELRRAAHRAGRRRRDRRRRGRAAEQVLALEPTASRASLLA
jgi:hypothetical protein